MTYHMESEMEIRALYRLCRVHRDILRGASTQTHTNTFDMQAAPA